MQLFLKSTLLSALTFTSFAGATDYGYNQYAGAPNQYYSACEQLPAACCDDGCAVNIAADLLCWQAQQAGLEYAFSSTDDRVNIGSDKAPHFDWNCGSAWGWAMICPVMVQTWPSTGRISTPMPMHMRARRPGVRCKKHLLHPC